MSIETLLRSLGSEPTDIELTISTPSRMRVKGNPYPKAIKVQTLKCIVNFDYEKEMAKVEGAWVTEERLWGSHVLGTCLILHKKEYYVQVLVREASDPIYADGNDRIPAEILKPFLYSSNPNKVRDIKVSNIVSLGILILGLAKVDPALVP